MWIEDHGSEIIKYSYTKERIEAELTARWREYGYSTKPDKFIALSFDDGPCASSANGGTVAMLAILKEMNVLATFFVLGMNVRDNKDAARAILAAGHELANHSDNHENLGGNKPVEAIAENLDSASQAVREITGTYPAFFRAPFMSHASSLDQVCAERGMSLIDGTVHNDWPGDSRSIKESVLKNPNDGDIIVLHENNTSLGNTMAVLSEIITGLRERGFWILTVGGLAAVKEKTLEAGTRYKFFI